MINPNAKIPNLPMKTLPKHHFGIILRFPIPHKKLQITQEQMSIAIRQNVFKSKINKDYI